MKFYSIIHTFIFMIRNTILITTFFLSVIAIGIVAFSESPDDQLAYRMARSSNFAAIMNAGKRMATRVKQMPDSTRNKMRQFKSQVDQMQKNGYRSIVQKKDSLLLMVKTIAASDTSWLGDTKAMIPLYKRFNMEFPEYKTLSKAERSLVFKKAARLYIGSSKV